MSLSKKKRKQKQASAGLSYTSDDIARFENQSILPAPSQSANGTVHRFFSMRETNAMYRADHDKLSKKVFLYVFALVVLIFLSLCVTGAMGEDYPYGTRYGMYTPAQVFTVLYEHAYNAIGSITRWYTPHDAQWLIDNVPGYWAVIERAKVVGITLLCAILLSVAGMLYQNVFKNPIAGPGMLGVGSGVSMGMMLVVALFGASGPAMIAQRYEYSYAIGIAILVFVIVAGRKLSGKGRPFDIVTMLLLGSILSQLLGFITSYVTLFVMDEADYLTFYTLSQMLVVDTSALSWTVLGIATVASLTPIWLLRHKLTALALDEADARMMGINLTMLRAVALICGAVMCLAAQIHLGSVGMISMLVPFLARRWFGCESSKQLMGSVCIGTLLLLVVRDVTDLIPFVGDGFAMGSVMSVVAMPLFIMVMSKAMSGREGR